MRKMLITDLDDTLYGWLDFFVPAFYSMAEEVAQTISVDLSLLLKEYKQKHQEFGSVEHPFVTLSLPSVRKKYQGLSDDEIKLKLGEAFHRFNSVRKTRLKLFDKVEDTLEKLNAMGVTVIGYTDSCEENGFYRLRKLGIDGYFKRVYVSKSKYRSAYPTDSKIRLLERKKPDVRALLSICENEGCLPKEVVYVGDSKAKDMYMAKMAGITSVLMNNPCQTSELYQKLEQISGWSDEERAEYNKLCLLWKKENMRADYEISSYSSLIDIFKEL